MSTKTDEIRTRFIWRWGTFGQRDKNRQYEELYAVHTVTDEFIANAGIDLVQYERQRHREAVAQKLVPAIYNGWMVENIKWFEGRIDDAWTFGEYLNADHRLRVNDGNYYFYTRIQLVASWDQPQMSRNTDDPMTYQRYSPWRVDSEDML